MYVRQPLGDVDWTSVLTTAITTAGQVIAPGSGSPVPTYTPAPYRSTGSSLAMIAALGLGAMFLLQPRRGRARR